MSGICVLRAAVKYLIKEKIENIHEKEKNLIDYALRVLGQVKHIEIGPKDSWKHSPVISF